MSEGVLPKSDKETVQVLLKDNIRLREKVAALEKSLAVVREALSKETADHKPSVATGLPCKCFLCVALKDSQESGDDAQKGGGGGQGQDAPTRKNGETPVLGESAFTPPPANPAAQPESAKCPHGWPIEDNHCCASNRAAPKPSEKCERCGWPLEDDVKKGCVKGNCSQRPLPPLRSKAAPSDACPRCEECGRSVHPCRNALCHYWDEEPHYHCEPGCNHVTEGTGKR